MVGVNEEAKWNALDRLAAAVGECLENDLTPEQIRREVEEQLRGEPA